MVLLTSLVTSTLRRQSCTSFWCRCASKFLALALTVSPDESCASSTVGWMQQWSALGQFAGPPLVASVAAQAGSWRWTWCVTGAACLLGLLLARLLAREVRR